MPDVRDALKAAVDPNLPRELLSLEQVQDTRPELLVPILADEKSDMKPAVKWIGKGKLPPEFMKVYGFKDEQTVQTWKIVPWAYADRVWLVYRPQKPILMSATRQPTLTVNGQRVELIPRVDHRHDTVVQWTCPLYYADVTGAIRFDGDNQIRVNEPEPTEQSPNAYILTAADRQ
jgi:hypothetical protein